MPKDANCKYCTESDELRSILVRIRDLETSTLYLFKDQTHRGRCVLALRGHKTEFFQLDDGERDAFARDIARAAKAIAEAFSPGKINYAAFGDLAPHFHVHLVPKYEGGEAWGKPFELAPAKPKLLDEKAYGETIAQIEKRL